MSARIRKPISGKQRVPLAAWPARLVNDQSTLQFVTKRRWTGKETDFVVERVLRAWLEHKGLDGRVLERMHMLEYQDGARIYQACAEAMRRARTAGFHVRTHAQHVEAIVGVAPRMGEKGGIGPSRYRVEGRAVCTNLDVPSQHPQLRSFAELALDAVLAASIPNWECHHAHDVRLRTLLPGVDPDSYDARLSVDTVLVHDGAVVGLVEVGRGTLMRTSAYIARRTVKRELLESAGFVLHACDVPSGPRSIEALRETVAWVVDRLGIGVVPELGEVRALVVTARAEAVLLFDLDQLAPLLRRWQQELGRVPLTWARYTERRTAMLADGHPVAACIPAQATLHRMLRASGKTLATLSGGGRRRGQAAYRHDGRRTRRPYIELKAHVRALGIRTPVQYRKHDDVTLPRDPKAVYPDHFPADGWAGFLGNGATNSDIAGMIPSSQIPRTAGFAWKRWKGVCDGLAPDAERPARTNHATARTYFKPTRVVPFLVQHGLIAAGEAHHVLAKLEAAARPSMGGAL